MFKRKMAAFAAALLLLPVCGASASQVQDSADGREVLSMADVDTELLTPASAKEPMTEQAEPEDLVTVVSRKNGSKGENINGGIRKASNTNIQLCREAYTALVLLFGAAEDDGVELYVRQGYRSYADQQERYDRAVTQGKTDGVAKPGETDYQTGLAATVVSKDWRAKTLSADFAQTPEYQWMAANAARFGFIVRYPEGKEDLTGAAFEPWHLRYVSADVATYLTHNDLCLEELDLTGVETPEAPEEDVQPLDVENGEDTEPLDDGMDVLPPAPTAEPPADMPVLLDDVGPDGDQELSMFRD